MQRESETMLSRLVHYILAVYSHVAGKTHFHSVQYIPIREYKSLLTNKNNLDGKRILLR